MSFEEASLTARKFAVEQGFSNLFLELEKGELGTDGRFTSPFSKPRTIRPASR